MSLNPGGTNYSWNYSNPNKEGYSTQLVGTVLTIQEVQKRGYTMNGQPGAPEFWPDGNPKMNIRIGLATPEGELKAFTFQPAGRQARMGQKKSVHMDLFHLTGDTDMMNLIGKTICISTQEGHYGQGNPRPWNVQLVEGGPYDAPLPSEFKVPQLLANNAASGGQVNAPQQQPQQYQQPPMQQQYQQHMQYQQPRFAAPAMQPVQQQQQYSQPMPQPMPQPQQYPQGMDPQIAQAMATQAFGGQVNVSMVPAPQPVDPVGSGYAYSEEDADLPF